MTSVGEVTDLELSDAIAELAGWDDETFREEVNADLRFSQAEDDPVRYRLRRAALRSPDLIDRWYTCLLMIAKSVEGQLAALQEDHEAEKADLRRQMLEAEQTGNDKVMFQVQRKREQAKARFSRARAGKVRFKTGLEEWVIEARGLRDRLRPSMYDSIVADERNHYAAEALRLRNAIRDHQTTLLSDDTLDPSPADEKLWLSLG